ncbi:unnamed protein product [Polarella glacialis]|uniref:Protein NLRC3 n=1 Tax=Polarella glacialis TaxID=89957 RepID=A0A813GG71_POLGL|nr:unnamed protein product [Polarella glacialis]
MKGHLKRSWAKTIQELAEIEGVNQQEGIETPEIPVQESPVRDPSQSGQQQVRAGADLEDHSMARPAHMASGDEVTALMKARQWEKPEQWTMTVQHWVDIDGACTEPPQYKSVMEQKKTVNMHDVCRLFVKPWSEGTGCSLAVLMSREVVCNAQLMVSHCWGEDVSETKESLLQHAVRHELPMTVPIWFCVFSNYQPEDGVGPKLEHQLALEPFASVIRNPSLKAANGGHGMVALHTTTDDLYSRLWCVHEVERAIVEEDVEIKASMSQKYIDLMVGRVEQFLGLGATLNDCFRAAGVQVQTAKARCSSKDDEEKLVKLILQQGKGFDGLDKVVENFRREQLPDIIFEKLIRKGLLTLDGASTSARADAAIVFAACQIWGGGQLEHATNPEVRERIRWALRGGDMFCDDKLRWQDLEVIDLEDLKLGQIFRLGVRTLAEDITQLRQSTKLSLDLGHNGLGFEGSKAVSEGIAQLKLITDLSLDLTNNKLGADGGQAVSKGIAQLKQITKLSLDLSVNCLGYKGGQAVSKAIAQLKQITDLSLDLRHNGLGDEGSQAVFEAIAQLKQITDLNLNLAFNDLSADGGKTLFEAMAQLKQITTLSLNSRDNKLGADGGKAVSEGIAQLKQITKLSLDLSVNRLGDKGGQAVSEGIAQLKQITKLSLTLRDNDLDDKGGQAVFEAIAQLKQITDLSLDLSYNKLSAEGRKAVSEGIAQLKQITKLSLTLRDNDLDDKGGQAVFEAIAQLKQITDLSLDLSYNKLSAEGRKAVSEGIAQLKHITNLPRPQIRFRILRGPEPWEEQLLRAGPLTSQQLSLFLDKWGISKDVEQTFCRELRFAPEEIIRCLSSISGLSGSPVRAARAARDARSRRGEELRQMKGHLKRSWAKTIQELAEIEGANLEDLSMARPAHMASGDEMTALMKARQWEKPEQWTITVQHWVDIVGACTETPQYKSVMEQKKTVNMHDVCRLFVKPWSEGTGCSLAVLMSREVVCNAQLMVSHCWSEDVSETKESLLQHAVRHELPMTVPIWFCVFSNYQPEDGVGPKLEHQLALEPFASVIRNPSLKAANGGHGMVALHTTTDDLYSRLWCVHEVERAIVEEDVEIKASMSQKYIDLMVGRVEQFLGLGATLNDCFRAAGKDDEEKLVKLILQQANGFDGLDKVVEDFRREQLPDIIFETLIRKGLLTLDGASTSARADAAIVFAACQMHGGGQLEHATNPEVRERIRLALRGGDRFCDDKLRWQDLEVIDLEDLKLGQILRLGVRTLPEMRQITKLSLAWAGEGLGAKGCKTLFEALAQLKQITNLSLNLGRNGLGDEGGKAVSEGIAQLKQITDLSLDLSYNSLGDEGGEAVSEGIAQLKQITTLSLDLGYNGLGDEGSKAVSEAIAQLEQITKLSLNLEGNNLGFEGSKAASEGIAQLKQITDLSLTLEGNDLGFEGSKAVSEGIAQLKQITKLSLNLRERSWRRWWPSRV